ncbi:MAG: RagB/SusD family nutrient uptake outer membrane protein [Bacteroidetes bacterium]|nr:RagB/SusD family nutrient uptake outer membrane protein [Bacteroidota bacterium]
MKVSIPQMKIKTGQMLLLSILLVSNSCNDFLDEVPDNRVALENLDKAAQLLTSAYSIISPAFTDWMTDDVGFIRGTTIRPNHTQAYLWEEFFDDPNELDAPVSYWFETYTAIAHANEVLAVLDGLPAVTNSEIEQKMAVESEALLTRAYGHFMLVNLFSKHYKAQTASTDLGVPYVEKPETVFIQQYTRNTVQEVYDKVERDLLRGIELVNDNFFANSGKYHFNRNAALAFASRFYLFKEDYEKCIEFSTRLLGNSPGNFVRDMTSEEFLAASSSITGYPQLYSSPDLPGNLLLIRKISLVQRPDFAHGPTNTIYNDLFAENPFAGTTDTRENPAFVKGENGLFPVRYESLFERSSLNSDVGFPYHIALAFRGEEVLLNRAEAYTQMNRLPEALDDLQVLVDNRYSLNNALSEPPLVTIDLLKFFFGASNNPFIRDSALIEQFLMLERRKEFIVQGMRWFDIKRFELEVEHELAGGGSTVTLKKDDRRKVLQIPSSAIDVGGLEPNPR